MIDKEKSGNSPETNLPQITTQAKLDTLKASLEKTTDTLERKKIREEILSINRSVNRTKQYTQIAWEKLAEWKNSLNDISAANLMRLDKELKWKSKQERRWEFLAKSFLYKRTLDDKWDIFEEATDGKNLKEWDSLYVDFGNNISAETKIGAWDFLPLDISVIKVVDTSWNIRIWKRSIQGNKVWYYDDRWYIPVYNGFNILIPSKIETEKYVKESNPEISLSNNQDDEEKAMDAFIEISDRYEKISWGFSPWELEKRQAFQKEATIIAKEMQEKYGIPWEVSYAQAALESGWWRSAPGNNYFWIKGSGQDKETKEFIDWKWVTINASFRTYDSMRDSFEDHAKLIKKQWPNAFNTQDPLAFVQVMVESPPKYATDPGYVTKIKSIIDGYEKLATAKPSALELMGTSTPDTIISMWEKMLGVPYIGGRSDENATDCSWFISKIMRDSWVATPWFRQTAAWLKRYTNEVSASETKKWDLMFFWWPHMYSKEPTWNHIAIVLEPPQNWMVKILDASWKSNEWKVAIRTVKIEDKHKFWSPTFYA
jgi:flagellum-specific peptidoglycan hydrolase FlgJ